MSPTLLAKLNAATLALFYACLPSASLIATGNPAEWAKAKRYFAPGESPLYKDRTKFTFDSAPWCEEPCVQAINTENEMMVLWFGSNLGKTGGVMMNVLGYTIDEAPGGCLISYKTQEQAEKFVRNTVNPAITACPALLDRVAPAKSRDSANTVSFKKFPGGYVSFIGTESITGFRLNRAPVVMGDEIDSYEGKVGEEGDPVDLLLRRADGFPQSIKILSSTATIKGRSRIEKAYERSDQRKWFVLCPSCGHEHTLKRANVHWPEGKLEQAKWLCLECHELHTDEQRRTAVKHGKWKPTAPFTGVRGYWISGFNSLMPPNPGYKNRLHQWAKEISAAPKAADPNEARKVLIQCLDTETWQDDEDAKPEWKEIADRREDWTALPNGIVWLTAGVDVHPDRLEATVEGWGRSEECWTLEHHVLSGDPREPEVWGRLEAALYAPRTRQDGGTPRLIAVGVDTGHPPTQRQAYAFIRPRQSKNWFALKGSSQVEAPIIVRPKKSSTVDRVKLLTVGTNRVKGLIYDRSAIVPPKEPGSQVMPGTMHFHRDLSDVYFQQLLSEDSFPVFKNGVRLREFKKPTQSTRNETLDTKTYSYASLVALGPLNFEAENARLLAEKAERDRVAAGQPEEQEAPPVQHNGFVNSGRWRI